MAEIEAAIEAIKKDAAMLEDLAADFVAHLAGQKDWELLALSRSDVKLLRAVRDFAARLSGRLALIGDAARKAAEGAGQ